MEAKKIFLGYGILLLGAGIIGFMMTGAKSALISGSVTGIIMVGSSMLTCKNDAFTKFGVLITMLFTGVFAWRFSLVLEAAKLNPDKNIAANLLGVMMAGGILSLITLFFSKRK